MAGDLLIPRCEVYWGDINLTAYPESAQWPGVDGPQPLVYNVKVSLQESSQTPSGSMKWNPSGLAFTAYEKILTENYDKTITVRYYYLTGRSITFSFVWAGQTENYGRDMSMDVKLSSELDGLIMANIKSVAQAAEKGIPMKTAISEIEVFYGVNGFNLIKYHPVVEKDLAKVKIMSNYSEGTTFASALDNIGEQNGNLVFLHNIKQGAEDSTTGTGTVFFPPYTWEGSTYANGEVTPNLSAPVSVEFLPPTAQAPDPVKRYGYFLGPSIINTITKTSEWSPPQRTQTYTLGSQAKVQPKTVPPAGQPKPTVQQAGTQVTANAAARTGGASGTHGSRSRPGMRLEGNEEGEKKKLLIQQERTAKLSAALFMCPALTGIKPCDIVFIPNYAGTYMEDWIVTSVEYEQTDGGVNLNVQAARQFGMGNLMHEVNGKWWLGLATSLGLVGASGTLENWVKYAWTVAPDAVNPPPASPTNQGEYEPISGKTFPIPAFPFEESAPAQPAQGQPPVRTSQSLNQDRFNVFFGEYGNNLAVRDPGFQDWAIKNNAKNGTNFVKGKPIIISPEEAKILYDKYPTPVLPPAPPSAANPPLTVTPNPQAPPSPTPGASARVNTAVTPFNSIFGSTPGGNYKIKDGNFDQWLIENNEDNGTNFSPYQEYTLTPEQAQRLYGRYEAYQKSREPLW